MVISFCRLMWLFSTDGMTLVSRTLLITLPDITADTITSNMQRSYGFTLCQHVVACGWAGKVIQGGQGEVCGWAGAVMLRHHYFSRVCVFQSSVTNQPTSKQASKRLKKMWKLQSSSSSASSVLAGKMRTHLKEKKMKTFFFHSTWIVLIL